MTLFSSFSCRVTIKTIQMLNFMVDIGNIILRNSACYKYTVAWLFADKYTVAYCLVHFENRSLNTF